MINKKIIFISLSIIILSVIIYIVIFKKENYIDSFLNEFFMYTFNKCSYCPNRECSITGICDNTNSEFYSMYNKYLCGKKENLYDCNKIKTDLNFFKVKKIIKNFELYDLITFRKGKINILQPKVGKYYLLNGYNPLSWRNIKAIDKNSCKLFYGKRPDVFVSIYNIFNNIKINKDQIPSEAQFDESCFYFKILFWYFRKCIVDTILSKSLKINNIMSLSVGSTNITSDYDMTLYGNSYKNISKTIVNFKKKFHNIFHETSDYIFDTNLYGISFIDIDQDNSKSSELNHTKYYNLFYSDIKTCGNKKFKYVRSDTLTPISSHIWVLIKVYTKLEEIQKNHEVIYELLNKKLDKLCNNENICKLLDIAQKTINMYPSQPENLPEIINLLAKKDIKTINENYFNNFISYVSYNSLESYFCRGTFLDVVLNSQMCAGDSDKIILSPDEYLDSFIENTAELLTHYHKEKYLKRAKSALINLNNSDYYKINPILYSTLMEKLSNIQKLQLGCSTEENILSCSYFDLIDECLTCIILIINECFPKINPVLIDLGVENFIINDDGYKNSKLNVYKNSTVGYY